MTEKKVKMTDYQKALSAYTQAMKAFHKPDYNRAAELLKAFLEKYVDEKELIDRSHTYLKICKNRLEKKTIQLKTFDDYYEYSLFEINDGEYEESLKLLNKALEKRPKEGKIYYLMADVFCLIGEKDKCLEYLKRAIQVDKYFQILAQNESDFEPLWEDKKFMLITRMK